MHLERKSNYSLINLRLPFDFDNTLLNRLQSVLNAAARSIAGLRRSGHDRRSCQFSLATSTRAH